MTGIKVKWIYIGVGVYNLLYRNIVLICNFVQSISLLNHIIDHFITSTAVYEIMN
ncbi:MAG: hypothetical protein H6Q60_449 [Oscillospiraceae bacterium]|nr:hypothetical protein [Oscillospiraceae bacterium]